MARFIDVDDEGIHIYPQGKEGYSYTISTPDDDISIKAEMWCEGYNKGEADMGKWMRGQESKPMKPRRVIYHDPATIILWADGSKTIVKCSPDTEFDAYAGFCAAVVKKLYGKARWQAAGLPKDSVQSIPAETLDKINEDRAKLQANLYETSLIEAYTKGFDRAKALCEAEKQREDVDAIRAAMKQALGLDIVSGSDMSKSKGVYTMGGIEPEAARERDADANKTIEKPKSIETGVFGMGVSRAVYDSPAASPVSTLISGDSSGKLPDIVRDTKQFNDSVPESEDESVDTQGRQNRDGIRNSPICYKCLSDMEPDGGNMWVCRECGHKVDDGQKRDKPVHDSTTAFDWFFREVFKMRRVAKDHTKTRPNQGAEEE